MSKEICIKLSILLLLIFQACKEEPVELPDIKSGLSDQEKSLINVWSYEYIIAQDDKYLFATNQMELGTNISDLGGNRAQLFRRRIVYDANGTYQLQWTERGDYQLGTVGTPNWQPNFGYWEIKGDTLIHNRGMFYEVRYGLELSSTSLKRTSIRYMAESLFPNSWEPGEFIQQSEYFISIN